MTLWIILTAMTAVVAIWAAIPFLRRADGGESFERAREEFRRLS